MFGRSLAVACLMVASAARIVLSAEKYVDAATGDARFDNLDVTP